MKNQEVEALTPEQTAIRDKIRGLFYSTQAANRALAFELAHGAGCYEAMVEEFYALLGELPNFEWEKKDYHSILEEEGEPIPEGMALMRAHLDFFTGYFFEEEVELSRRYNYSDEPGVLETFPKVLLNMTFIKKLNLGWNAIKKLPEGIEALQQLEELDLSFNDIRGGLPDALGELSQLKTLILYGMSEVFSAQTHDETHLCSPCIRRLKNLTHLDLREVRIDGIPEWIHELEHLEYLSISGNSGSYPGLLLPDSFTQLPRLKSLEIRAYTLDVPKNIDQMQSLEYLAIQSALSIPVSIKNLKHLKVLDLSYLSSDYPIGHPDYDCLWNLSEKGLPEGWSRLRLYGWAWLKEMTQLDQFIFTHIKPYALTEKERAELEAALPNCRLTLNTA